MIALVEQLSTTWTSIDELCTSLTEDEWKRPTGCPGWTVQDQVAHLVDYEATALRRPRPEHAVVDLSHTRNELGAANEIGVDARRRRTGAEVLAELREVTAARLEQLSGLDEARLDTDQVQTPIGPAPLRDALTLRVMDTWSHEQDIRRALGRPGHDRGDVVATSIGWWTRFLPAVVGKRVRPPDGTSLVFEVADLPPIALQAVDGRVQPVEAPASPTVVLRMGAPTFAALVGGRTDADRTGVDVAGDHDLAARVLDDLAFLP